MSTIKICDVTLRDGLQALDREVRVPLEQKVRLFDALRRARLPYIEVGSYVNPRVMPAMRVTPDLLAAIDRGAASSGGIGGESMAETAVLVPTMKYYEKFRGAPKVSTVALLLSASEGYSKLNVRMSTAEAMAAARGVAAAARADGYRVRAYLSYCFRDYGHDNRPQSTETVSRLVAELVDFAEMVAISDTNGTATPDDVGRVMGAVEKAVGLDKIGIHLHDRYGMGITNSFVAYQAGVRIFDSAIGGIGGNKMVKGSVSNISTEELVFMFHSIGVDTGLDFDALLEAGHLVEDMISQLEAPPSQSKILLNRVEGLPAGM